MVDAERRSATTSTGLQGHVHALSPAVLERYRLFTAGRPLGPAQEPRWVEAWQDAAPVVVVELTENGAPVLMLPLELARVGTLKVARFIGGRHANANYPAFRTQDAAPTDWLPVLRRSLRASGHKADLLLLERMNDEREGVRNPLLGFAVEPSPNLALAVTLADSFEDLLSRPLHRKRAAKNRAQARKFEAAGGWRRIEADTPEEATRLLEAFFALKAERFRHAGIPDVFAEPSTRDAFTDLFARGAVDAAPRFRMQGLEVGGKLRALTGTSYGTDRVTCEFGAIASDELSKQSPGEFLFYLNIEDAYARGAALYDFGVGDEPYKRSWCDAEMTHWDAVVPLSFKGRALAGMLRGAARLKTVLKRSPFLWRAFKRLRKQTAGATGSAGGED